MFSQRGQAGELHAGGQTVARFGAWLLVRPDDVLACDVATVQAEALVVIDTFRAAHVDLDLWLDCGTAWWVWRHVVPVGAAEWRTRGGRPEIRIK